MMKCLYLLFVVFHVAAGVLTQKVKVDPEVVSYPGQTVILCCQFPDKGQTHLTQVAWILENSSATRTNIAVFHPTFGVSYPASPVQGRVSFTKEPPPLEHPTIQITDIALTDEGNYVCEYATYPTGNENGVTALVILAKPQNTASTITVPAGTSPVSVAQCVSANGRPPATLTWVTNLSGNGTGLVQTSNSDNTVTVRSEYLFTPTAADNGKEITCVVSHRTLTKAENFPMKLVVQYPPQVQIVGYDNNWYVGRTDVVLTCQYQGNPSPPTVNWKMSSGFIPDSVEMAQNKLTVRKVDDSVNTTFICEVTNSLGIGKDQVTVFVRVGRRETSTHSRKTDTTPSSEPPQSKTTNSPPASTTVKQDKPDSSLPLVFIILAVLLLVIPGVVAFICWRRKGGRCGENVITEGRPDCKRKRKDQTEPDVTYATVTHVNTAGAARVQINAADNTEYASIITR